MICVHTYARARACINIIIRGLARNARNARDESNGIPSRVRGCARDRRSMRDLMNDDQGVTFRYTIFPFIPPRALVFSLGHSRHSRTMLVPRLYCPIVSARPHHLLVSPRQHKYLKYTLEIS